MSAAFTPGPWTFDGPPDSRIVWAGAENRVCFLTSNGPNLANARLIAAAPELYETGQAIIDRMSSTYRARNGREMGIEGEDGEKCWIVHSDDIEALRAALAKARGEQ